MRIPPFKLERYFAKHEFNTEFLLSSSDCESMSIQEILDLEYGSSEKLPKHWLGYTESQGAPSLRYQISSIYKNIDPDQILVHSGAEEAIFLFMLALLEPGDHIIVHWPCYQSLTDVAKSLGCQVSTWVAQKENNWRLDLDDLTVMLQDNTKAIVINTPHNPTGYLMEKETYLKLYDLVESRGLVLFSDEVYRESEYDPKDCLPAACDLGGSAVSLGVMSKTYGLAGLRIGWIAAQNKEIYLKIAQMKDYTTICNSAPSEFLAEIALKNRQKLINRNMKIIRENLVLLDDFFIRHKGSFQWQKPIAGPIAFPELLHGDVKDFCYRLIKNAGVLLLPGSLYDHPGNHFRIGFGRRNMPQAIASLERFLEES